MILRLLLILMLFPSISNATRYWGSPTGSDANACTSVDGEEDPGVYKATPAGVIACMAGGDRGTMKAGTYTGSTAYVAGLPAGPSSAAPTIFEGDPGDIDGCALTSSCSVIFQPTANPSRITVSNVIVRKLRLNHVNLKSKFPLEVSGTPISNILVEDVEAYNTEGTSAIGTDFVTGVITTPGTSFVTLRRTHSHNNGNHQTHNGHGFYIQGDDSVIEYSLSEGNANTGIQCYTGHATSDGRPDRCVIQKSIFRNNYSAGIVAEGNDDKILHNLVHGNGSGVLLGYTSANRTHVYGNTIYNNGGAGVQLRLASDNSEIKNNVIFGNGLAIEVLAGVTGIIQTHNACSSSQSCGSTGKLTIAALTDILVSTSDFRLKAGSSAINAGTSVSDYACNSTCDIGAFEAVPTPTGTITANTATLSFPIQNGDVPLNIPSTAGVSVACTGHASCPGSPTISTAVRRVGTDTLVDVTILGITGNACAATQTWTISYSRTTGSWTDNAKRGYTDHQPVDSFTNLALTNNCTGSGPASYPSGYHLFYKFNENIGVVANDESTNNLDCTLTNSATWGTGKTGTGLGIASGTSQYCAIPWGFGIDPTTQSMTIFMPVNIATGETANLHYLGGPTLGTNQRFYVCGRDGTWRLAIQGTRCEFTAASNLTVESEWNLLTIVVDSSTDVATLYKGTTAGTGGATSSYTSFTFANDWRIGKLDSNNTTGNYVFDDFIVYLSLKDPADLVAAFEVAATALTGSFAQAAIQFQGVILDATASPIVIGAAVQTIEIPAGGAVVVLFQVHCQNVSNCDATAFKFVYAKNSSGVWQQVPDIETTDGVWMWGSTSLQSVNNGARSSRLTGSCTLTTGTTQVTSAQTPTVDLPQDGCVVQAYIVKVGSTHAGDYYDFKLRLENDADFPGGYTQTARTKVVNPMASGVGF